MRRLCRTLPTEAKLLKEETAKRMDIEILLALQGLRESLGSGFESAVAGLSESIMMVGLVLCTFVYWSVNKKTGQFALMCFSVGNTLNQFVKNIACVYRPWILDSRIAPASGALGGATGYSFPSGHTVMSGTTFGSIAWRVRRKLPVVAVVLVVIVLLEAFLRMFLGVHTPQDVLAALAESLLVVLLGSFAYDRYEARCEKTGRNRDGLVLLGVVVLCVACIAVIELKEYPMDYVDGVLLVDPDVMKRDIYEGVGAFSGMFAGWYCERRWVNFEVGDISVGERVLRCVVGIALVAGVFFGFDMLAKALIGPALAKLTSRFVAAFFVMFVVPLLFGLLHRPFAKRVR